MPDIRLKPTGSDVVLGPATDSKADIRLAPAPGSDITLVANQLPVAPAATGGGSITGTGSLTFAFSEAATGTETFTGTGGVAFGFSEAASGAETFTSTGGVSFGFSESGTGAETFTSTGGVAFGFSESGTGVETFTSTGGLTFGFSLDGVGTVGSGAITGTGDVTFGFSLDGTGTNDSIQPSHGGGRIGGRPHYIVHQPAPTVTILPEPILPEPIEGDGGVRFGFSIAAIGDTNDDDLAILLAA